MAEQSRRTDDRVLGHTLVEALEHLDTIELVEDTRDSLYEFRRLHRTMLSEVQGAGLSDLARLILSRTGAWQEIDAMPTPSDLSARLNVHRFLDFTEHWSPLEGGSSLEAFLDQLDLISNNPVEGLDTARIGGEDAVALTTVHRAKGSGVASGVSPGPSIAATSRPRRAGCSIPPGATSPVPAHLRIDTEFKKHLDPSLNEKARRDWLRGRHYDQEWRLAYVATTRAKEYLYLSGAHWYGVPQPHKKPSKPSDLIELARHLDGAVIDRWTAEPPPRPETLRFPIPQPGPDPILGVTWEEALHRLAADPDWAATRAEHLGIRGLYDEAVEEFEQAILALPEPVESDPEPGRTSVSVTGLVTYADCPKRYFWSEVDRLPRRPSPSARRGTQLHRRIELHNRGMVPFDELEDDLYDRSPDEDATGPEGARGGWNAFLKSPYATRTPVYVEVPFELRLSADALIRGRVDAVYPYGDQGWGDRRLQVRTPIQPPFHQRTAPGLCGSGRRGEPGRPRTPSRYGFASFTSARGWMSWIRRSTTSG